MPLFPYLPLSGGRLYGTLSFNELVGINIGEIAGNRPDNIYLVTLMEIGANLRINADSIRTLVGNLALGAGGGTSWQVQSAGGHLTPDLNGLRDIGLTGIRTREIFASDGVRIGTGGGSDQLNLQRSGNDGLINSNVATGVLVFRNEAVAAEVQDRIRAYSLASPAATTTRIFSVEHGAGNTEVVGITTAEAIVTGDLVATGGFRRDIGPWVQENVAAAQAAVEIARCAPNNPLSSRWVSRRAGSVTGLSVWFTAALTAGGAAAFSASVRLNGVVVAGSNLNIANPNQKGNRVFAKDLIAFAAGDDLTIEITTSATFAPVTTDVYVDLEVEE